MRQILYTSRASEGDAGTHLPDILFCSRRNNPELGVTGILLVHGDHFLQLLEGDPEQLDFVVDTIAGDPRHCDMRVILDRTVARPSFPHWSMAALPAGDGAEDATVQARDFVARSLDPDGIAGEALVEDLAALRARLKADAVA
ncbi:BLUF domain-containing protein [Palleronia rufa]|uniref:BLUF domain-containing protein n=1 Tax=Palleronia rufa TaxID=1530186 RepID=UPI00068DDD13|nr:BLUF domain-containing protein [Palleronia rufa]